MTQRKEVTGAFVEIDDKGIRSGRRVQPLDDESWLDARSPARRLEDRSWRPIEVTRQRYPRQGVHFGPTERRKPRMSGEDRRDLTSLTNGRRKKPRNRMIHAKLVIVYEGNIVVDANMTDDHIEDYLENLDHEWLDDTMEQNSQESEWTWKEQNNEIDTTNE